MKRFISFFFFVSLCVASVAKPFDTLRSPHIEFIPNLGQWSGNFQYRASLGCGALFLEKNAYLISVLSPEQLDEFHETKYNGSSVPMSHIDAAAYRVSFIGANDSSFFTSASPYRHHYNYFYTADTSRWRSNVVPYSSISLSNLYDGIDLRFAEGNNHLKYEFVLQPYADISQIVLEYDGVNSLSLSSGFLMVNTSVCRIVEYPPYAYQLNEKGDTVSVDCKYVLRNNRVSFSLGDYDNSLPLIVDPVVVFSSFSGSISDNWGYTATYDAQGNLYGGGISFGPRYPVTTGAYQITFASDSTSMFTDVSISKFDSSGSFIHYATFLGGYSTDIPHSLFVNDNNELYVFGSTGSMDFPVTPNAYDTSFNFGPYTTLSTSLKFPNGSDIFVSKFSADGSQLLASTFIGGSANDGINTASILRKNYADDNRGEILVDDFSNVYVVSSTFSSDFPVTSNSFDTTYNGGQDVCIFKLSQDLSQLMWSSFLGGSSDDAGYSVFLAEDKSLYLCGGTRSVDWPISGSVLSDSITGVADGFVAHVSQNGDYLLQSSFLGNGDYDQAYLIKGDRDGNPYVLGQTNASGSAWIRNAQYSVPNGGQFLVRLTPALDGVVWSTAFGTGAGGPDISPTALMVDYCNNIYLSGWGSASLNGFGGTAGLPVTPDAFQSTTDGSDYYFMSISDDASQLVYATYFGGATSHAREHVDGGTSRFDRKGRIYQAVCAGCGRESSFPTTPGAYCDTNLSSNCNLGVIKMDFSLPVVVADFTMPSWLCAPDVVHFSNQSQLIGNNTSFFWNFGDGTTSSEFQPSHTYSHAGLYEVSLVVRDNGSCNFSDTLVKRLLVLANSSDTLSILPVCYGDFVQLGLPPSLGVTYQWFPAQEVSNPHISNPITTPSHSSYYTLLLASDGCSDTLYQFVDVDTLALTFSADTSICLGDTAFLSLSFQFPSSVNTIEWSLSPNFTEVFNLGHERLVVSPNETTTYYVRVRSDVCTRIHPFVVNVSDMHIWSAPDLLICFEEGDYLHLQHDGGPGCTYVWQLEDGTILNGESPYVSPSSSTHYTVTVTNGVGCYDVAEGEIIRRAGTFPMPFEVWCENCTTIQNEITTVFSTYYGDGYTYRWTPATSADTPDSASTTVHPLVNTTYVVQVTDSFGCVKIDSVNIEVTPLICDTPFVFIPNIFTPNDDGHNDVVYVRSSILEKFQFVIYSRWGQKIFETSNQDEGWDGTFKGKPCQNGIYDYYFKGTCIDGQESEQKGNIMLVR